MTAIPVIVKPPDLTATPEEITLSDMDEKARGGHSGQGLNFTLQEKLLGLGNFGALLDDGNEMARRPSVGSVSADGSSIRDSDDGGYFSMKRSPSQQSQTSIQQSFALLKRKYVIGVVGDDGEAKSSFIETFNAFLKRSNLPRQKFIELNPEDPIQAGRTPWPSNQPPADGIILCKDASVFPPSRDTTGPLIDAFKSLSCPLFVLLLKSPLSTPIGSNPETPINSADPLNDPLVSRAFSQQTKIRFLRVGPSMDEIQRTCKEILAILDQEVPQASPMRARGLSSPTPYSRNNALAAPDSTLPYLGRRGSEATSRQLQGLSNQPLPIPPPVPQVAFQKARPFQLVLGQQRQGGTSPPQSPKTTKSPQSYIDSNLSDTSTADYLSSRLAFSLPTLPKLGDPPSPAGTPPTGSRRHSRLIDSESDLASSDVVGEEGLDWPTDDQEEFARALANLNLMDGGGQTWEDLIDRLCSPGIPGEDDDFLAIFLVFYRKFAAPSTLLHGLIAKFEEASRSAIDYMLQMIIQTRCCDVLTRWLLTHPNDFCYPSTHAQVRAFIASLEQTFILAHYTYELLPIIDNIKPNPEGDPDRFWGRTDDSPDLAQDDEEYELKHGSQSVPISPTVGTPLRKRSHARGWDFARKYSVKEEHEAPGRLQHTKDISPLYSRKNSVSHGPSEPSSPEFSRTPSQSITPTVDGKEIAHRLELMRSQSDMSNSWVDLDGQRRSESYSTRERKESSASSAGSGPAVRDNIKRMSAFWDATPEEIAVTLTKMEWEYFIALKPRDIPRYMWTPEDKRDKDSPMDRIVYFFNHVARWVAWTVLYSSRLKDRVRDLEKMLRVAVELRKLDNYDTLFAVISGLENQSVYRLTKTLEEVKKLDFDQAEDGKKRSQGSIRTAKTGTLWLKYQSCRALMARDRNFSPYRMAFKNSFSSRIPWLSRHKADMLSAAAVNKTYLAPSVIKWSGFQVIGESLLSVLQCQNYPYNLGNSDEFLERAILETPDVSDQELDAKSHELEPPAKRSYSKSHSTGSQWISKTFNRR